MDHASKNRNDLEKREEVRASQDERQRALCWSREGGEGTETDGGRGLQGSKAKLGSQGVAETLPEPRAPLRK